MKKKEVLLAMVGVNPQIVTISLDLLSTTEGVAIGEVASIYTDNEQVKVAVKRLDEELKQSQGAPHRSILIGGMDHPVEDFLTKQDAVLLFRTLYQEIKAYKQANWRIHLSIAGGRRVMSAYALVVAQLLFDEDDRCWHLFSDFWQRDRDRKMHLEPGDHAILVPVPVLRWSPMAMRDADLAFGDDPWEVIERQDELQQRERDLQLRAFLRGLRPAKRAVAQLLAEGLDNHSIADRRGKSINTVTKQIIDIYGAWREFFGVLPPNAPVRDQIVAELSGYFSRNPGEKQ
jgi:CRISPR-associated Csx14 family protein